VEVEGDAGAAEAAANSRLFSTLTPLSSMVPDKAGGVSEVTCSWFERSLTSSGSGSDQEIILEPWWVLVPRNVMTG
jgi:hypothetical protein